MLTTLLFLTAIGRPANAVTLDGGCRRMPVLLGQISKQTGVELRCKATFEDEVLFVSVKEKSLDLLMSQIAEVCHAEWQKEGSAQVLTRTPAEAAQDSRDEQKLNLNLIKASLAKQIEAGKKPVMSSEEEAARLQKMADIYKGAGLNLPGVRNDQAYEQHHQLGLSELAMNRLLATIDLSAMAGQPVWQKRLFATSPNRYQYPLGPKSADSLGAFVKEQNLLINLVRSMDEEEKHNSRYIYARYGEYFVPIVEPVSAFIETQCYGCDYISLEAMFVDADGYVLDIASAIASLWPEADPAKSFDGLDKWGSTALSYSDRTKQTINRATIAGQAASTDPLASKPLEKDPLSYFVDEPLSQIAEETKHEIVASIPDEIARPLSGFPTEPHPLTDFCKVLVQCENVKNDNGTLLISPLKRAQAYSLRAKRKPLQELIAIGRTRPVTIDEAGAYALKQNDFAAPTQLELLVANYNQAKGEALQWLSGGLSYREASKLYALLSASQRARLTGEGLRYAELTPQQRDVFDFRTYSCDSRIMVQHQHLDRKRGILILDRIASVALSEGVPPDTLITMKAKAEKAVLVVSADGRREITDCSGVGYILSQQEKGDFGPNLGYQNIASSKLTPATATTYTMNIAYGPGISDAFTLHDAKIESTASLSWKDLPAEWMKPLTDTLEYYRKMDLGRPARQSPPPPFLPRR